MQYAAIIGDMVGSRKLPDRNSIQKKFLKATHSANRSFAAEIESPLTVTIGDEFQVLLHKIDAAPSLINFMKEQMYPVHFVFGVGIGAISTDINKEMAIGMDGPAFHHARRALEKAKKKKPGVVYISDNPATDLINALEYFRESCLKRRTRRQIEVVGLFSQGLTQEKIAVQLGITQETVSEIISHAYYWEIKEAEVSIQKFLAMYK